MSRKWILAIIIILVLAGWIASGTVGDDDRAALVPPAEKAPDKVLVEVRAQTAEEITKELITQGEVQPARNLVLRSEVAGIVEEVLVRKGALVEAGELVVRLAGEDRAARLREARATLEQVREEYRAAEDLAREGFESQQRLRQLNAQLQAARATVERIEQELEDTEIAAPYDGIINALPVEEGEYVAANGEIATLIDNDPLHVMVQIPQQRIQQVEPDAPAIVDFATGEQGRGSVVFISANADPATRTFRVEIEVPNPELEIPSGVSAEARIPVEQVPAHFMSPALLSLNTEGELGVKTVTAEGIVEFHSVDIVRSRADGIWVAGLPEQINLIVSGQGYVRAGEEVRVTGTEGAEAPETTRARPSAAGPDQAASRAGDSP